MYNYRFKIFIILLLIFGLSLILLIMSLNIKVQNFYSTYISVYHNNEPETEEKILIYLDLTFYNEDTYQLNKSKIKSIKYYYNNKWITYNKSFSIRHNKLLLTDLQWEIIGNLLYVYAIIELEPITVARYLWSMF